MDEIWTAYRGAGWSNVHWVHPAALIFLSRLSHRAHGGRDLADDDIGVRASQKGWLKCLIPD